MHSRYYILPTTPTYTTIGGEHALLPILLVVCVLSYAEGVVTRDGVMIQIPSRTETEMQDGMRVVSHMM
jgi:hypothetical protein